MRIAFVVFTDFPERTAPARRVHLLGKGLAQRGHEVHVLVPQRFTPGPLEQIYDGLHVRWCEQTDYRALTQLSRRIRARLILWRELERLAQRGLDWLVTYNLGMDAMPMSWSLRRHGGYIAAMYDDLPAYPQERRLEDHVRRFWIETADRWLPQQAKLNIAISTFLAARLQMIAPQTRNLVIPILVDPERFRLQAEQGALFRLKWNLDMDIPVIAYLGSFWHVEGVAVLLQAIAEMARNGLAFRVVICGEAVKGLDCDDVPGLVEKLKLQHLVRLTGWLPTDQVIAAMSAADILVVPKLDHVANRAGLGTKLAEYLAMGKAIATSNVGDVSSYLLDGRDALFVEASEPMELAKALTRLVISPALRESLGNEARLTALRCFDYRHAAEAVEAAMLETQSLTAVRHR